MNKKVVLITGCSSGFGRAICESLSKDKYFVVATARKLEMISDLKADMKLSLDVCDEESIRKAIETIYEKICHIDILINNAGFSVRAALEEIDLEKMHEMYEVNVFGIVRMMQAVLPIMRQQKSGKILNIGSISGRMTGLVNGGYCSTKYAVEALSEAARYEVADYGIEVTVVEPGAMDTNFFDTLAQNSNRLMSNVNSPYRKLYERDLNFRRKQSKQDVNTCAKQVVSILEKGKIKTRYTVGVSLFYRLYIHLPNWLKEYGMKKYS